MEQITQQKLNIEAAARLERLRDFLELDDTIAQGKMTITEYMNYDAALIYAIRSLKKEDKE